MLWCDDDFVSIEDLEALDSEIGEVAQAESISLEGPGGIIRRAKDRAFSSLIPYLSLRNWRGLTRTRNTVVNSPGSGQYEFADASQIVVSGNSENHTSTIRQYVIAFTLREIYRAAKNKAGDRYDDRYEAIVDEIKREYLPNLRRQGIPLVLNPLPAPGAILERAGEFSADENLSLVAGSGTSSDEIVIAITWVGSNYTSPTSKNNAESFRSSRESLALSSGNVARVSINNLTPPNGIQPDYKLSQSSYSPGSAAYWNVWAGDPLDTKMYRQNASLIPISVSNFTFPSDPVFSGERLDLGQYPDIYLESKNEIVRA